MLNVHFAFLFISFYYNFFVFGFQLCHGNILLLSFYARNLRRLYFNYNCDFIMILISMLQHTVVIVKIKTQCNNVIIHSHFTSCSSLYSYLGGSKLHWHHLVILFSCNIAALSLFIVIINSLSTKKKGVKITIVILVGC